LQVRYFDGFLNDPSSGKDEKVKISSFKGMACSIAGAADIVGDKWTILLVRDLFIGISKFDDFHTSLDIPTTTLANRLKVLTDRGLVEKRPYQSSPTRFAYRLTQKGRDLWPVLLAIAHWGDKYNMSGCGAAPMVFVDRTSGEEVKLLAVGSETGRPLRPSAIELIAGPGSDDKVRKLMSVRDAS
jgi:DNA-binding HxlR family transcriptional regulator